MTFSETLASKRQKRGLSLRALAHQAGVTYSFIHQIESGTNREPSFLKVVKLSRALGVSLNKLAETIS